MKKLRQPNLSACELVPVRSIREAVKILKK